MKISGMWLAISFNNAYGIHNKQADDFATSIEEDEKGLVVHILAESAPQFTDSETWPADILKKKTKL